MEKIRDDLKYIANQHFLYHNKFGSSLMYTTFYSSLPYASNLLYPSWAYGLLIQPEVKVFSKFVQNRPVDFALDLGPHNDETKTTTTRRFRLVSSNQLFWPSHALFLVNYKLTRYLYRDP